MQIHNRYRQAGGEDAVADTEATLLEEAGHEVTRIQAVNPSSSRGAVRALALASWNPKWSRRIAGVIERERPDIAHIHNTWYTISPSVIGPLRTAGIPTVMSIHNYRMMCVNASLFRHGRICRDCVGRAPWPGVLHACYRDSRAQSAVSAVTVLTNRYLGLWREVDVFVASSDTTRELLTAAGQDPDRIVVHENVLADSAGPLAEPARSNRVLFVGRLSIEKGADRVVEAWSARAAELRPLKLTVIGDGPERPKLEAAASSDVSFQGWMSPDAVQQAMREARALVFPSRWYEGFPRTIVEALAMGLPVMATRLGAHGEVARSLGPEWLVPDSVGAWSAALMRLREDSLVEAGGRAAHQRFRERHAADRGLERLEAAYAKAVDHAERRQRSR